MMPDGGNNGWATEYISSVLLHPRTDRRQEFYSRSRKSLVNEIWSAELNNNGNIAIRDAQGVVYDIVLATKPRMIDLAFDQLDRYFVTWEEDGGIVFMRWYNPLTSQHETQQIAIGKNPCCSIDDYRSIWISNSDIFLFYQRDNQIFYRIQRDRYLIEYEVPHDYVGVELLTCGMATNFRFSVRVGSEDGIILTVGGNPILVNDSYCGYRWGTQLWGKSSSNTKM